MRGAAVDIGGKSQKLSGEIARIVDGRESLPAQTQKLVAKLIFAQTSVMGAALRPLCGMAMRGGGKLDRGARWPLECWLKLWLV